MSQFCTDHPNCSHMTDAKEFLGTYFQVSRGGQIIARLPENRTGVQALADASKDPIGAARMGERAAGDHFLRMYARDSDLWRHLDKCTFESFRAAGGGTYSVKVDPDEELWRVLRDLRMLHDAEAEGLTETEKQMLIQQTKHRLRLITTHLEIGMQSPGFNGFRVPDPELAIQLYLADGDTA